MYSIIYSDILYMHDCSTVCWVGIETLNVFCKMPKITHKHACMHAYINTVILYSCLAVFWIAPWLPCSHIDTVILVLNYNDLHKTHYYLFFPNSSFIFTWTWQHYNNKQSSSLSLSATTAAVGTVQIYRTCQQTEYGWACRTESCL